MNQKQSVRTKRDDTLREALKQLGTSQFEQGMDKLQSIIEEGEQDERNDAHYYRALCLINQNRYSEAREEFNMIDYGSQMQKSQSNLRSNSEQSSGLIEVKKQLIETVTARNFAKFRLEELLTPTKLYPEEALILKVHLFNCVLSTIEDPERRESGRLSLQKDVEELVNLAASSRFESYMKLTAGDFYIATEQYASCIQLLEEQERRVRSASTARPEDALILQLTYLKLAIANFFEGELRKGREYVHLALAQAQKSTVREEEASFDEASLFKAILNSEPTDNQRESLEQLTRLIKKHAQVHELVLMRGVVYFSLGKHEAALKDFESATSLEPGCHRALFFSAASNLHLGKNEQASEDLQRAIRLSAKTSEYHLFLALTQLRLQLYADCFESLRSLVELDPKKTEVYLIKAYIHRRRGEVDQAEREYTKLLDVSPEHQLALIFRGYCRKLQERYQESRIDLDRAVGMGKDYQFLAYYYRGLLQKDLFEISGAIKDLTEALNVFEQSRLQESDKLGGIYNSRGVCYQQEGKTEEAQRDFAQSVRSDPTNLSAVFNSATQSIQSRDYARGEELFRTLLREGSFSRVRVQLQLALCRFLRKDSGSEEDAIRILDEEVLATEPNNVEGLFLRATIRSVRLSEHELVLRDLDAVIQRQPLHIPALNLRAKVHLDLKNFAASLNDVARVLSLDEKNPFALLNRSLFHQQKRNFQEAQKDIETALKSADRTREELIVFQAIANLNTGQLKEAEVILEGVLRSNPEHTFALLVQGILLQRQKSHERAKERLEKLLRLQQQHPFRKQAYLVLASVMRDKYEKSLRDTAVQEDILRLYDLALQEKEGPNEEETPGIKCQKALFLAQVGRKSEAVEILEECLQTAPRSANAQEILLSLLNREENSQEKLKQSVENLESDSVSVLIQQGISNFKSGNYAQSLDLFSRALKVDRTQKIAYYYRAWSHYQLSRENQTVDKVKSARFFKLCREDYIEYFHLLNESEKEKLRDHDLEKVLDIN